MLIGRPLAGCAHFSSLGRSISAPLAFTSASACLLAVLWLVVRVFPLLVARAALLCISPYFCMLIGRPLAGCERFSSFGRSVSALLVFPCVSATLIGRPLAVCARF